MTWSNIVMVWAVIIISLSNFDTKLSSLCPCQTLLCPGLSSLCPDQTMLWPAMASLCSGQTLICLEV